MDNIIMSKKEIQQVEILEKLARREISQKDGAKILQITPRQIIRKLKVFKAKGIKGLTHKNRGKPSKKKWDSKQEQLTIDLLKNDWHGFGPTFTAEKLLELHGIKISEEVVRKSMIKHGLWEVNK